MAQSRTTISIPGSADRKGGTEQWRRREALGFFYLGLMEWYDYRGFDSAIREVGDGFFTAGHPQALSGFKDLLKAIEYNAKFLPVIYGAGFAVLIVISAVLQIRKGDSEQQNPDAFCGKSRGEVR